MIAEQKKVLSLLNEVDELCRANKIEYTLTERTAAMAVLEGKFTCGEYYADIAMTPAQYKEFVKAFNAKSLENRVLETIENNIKMDGIYARYVDTASTLWDLVEGAHYKYKGFYIAIRILRAGTSEGKDNKRMEQLVRNNTRDALKKEIQYGVGDFNKRTRLLMASRFIYRKPGKMQQYWKTCMNESGKPEKRFYYLDKSKRVFEATLFEEYKDIEFEGETFRIVSDTEALLKACFGRKAASEIKETNRDFYRFAVFAEENVPYEDTLKEIADKNLYNAEDIDAQQDYFAYQNRKYIPAKQIVDRNWLYVTRTIDRINLYQKLEGHEPEIIDKYKAGGVEAVRDELKQYCDSIRKYAAEGMGFCIDKDLFEIACEILLADGYEKEVNKAKKNMPEEFEESLRDFLIREGCPAVK